MSNDNIMNIQLNKVTGRCDEKCMLKYNYTTSSTCVASNYGSGTIVLTYDIISKNPVTFNNNEYNVLEIAIIFPSCHYYNGEPSTGEIVILHSSTTASKLLWICIPISNRSGTPNNLFNNILNNIASIHISELNSSELKLDEEYNLNSILQYKPFYYYNQGSADIISYGLKDSIYITNDLAEVITSLVGVNSNNSMFGYSSSLFYNKNGPIKFDEDEIYIDCKPVNSSGKEEIIFKRDNNNNNNNNNSNNGTPINMTLIIILFIFIFVILLCVVSYNIYQKIAGSNTKSKYNSKIYSIVDYVLQSTKLDTVDSIVDYVIKTKKNDSK
jgi:hypothetical protein